MSLEKLWTIQETFYKDRPLMEAGNANPLYLLGRLEEEAKECREAIENCMKCVPIETCIDLLTQDIRQEISDLFTFVLALARNVGLTPELLVGDAIEKIARNMSRYTSKDYQDLNADFPDQLRNSRSWDKSRGFSKDFYVAQ